MHGTDEKMQLSKRVGQRIQNLGSCRSFESQIIGKRKKIQMKSTEWPFNILTFLLVGVQSLKEGLSIDAKKHVT